MKHKVKMLFYAGVIALAAAVAAPAAMGRNQSVPVASMAAEITAKNEAACGEIEAAKQAGAAGERVADPDHTDAEESADTEGAGPSQGAENTRTSYSAQTTLDASPAGSGAAADNPAAAGNKPASDNTAIAGNGPVTDDKAADGKAEAESQGAVGWPESEKVSLPPVEISSTVVIEETPTIKKIIHYNCYCGADFTDKDAFIQHAAEGVKRGEIHSWTTWVEEVEVWE